MSGSEDDQENQSEAESEPAEEAVDFARARQERLKANKERLRALGVRHQLLQA